MKEILEFILKNITTLPDDIKIEEKEEDGGTNYLISVNSADVGRIIGKEGKIIKAIRTIMRVIAIQKGVRVRVSVLSDEEKPRDEVTTPTDQVEITTEPINEEVIVKPSEDLTVEV